MEKTASKQGLDFSLRYSVQIESGAHTVPYTEDTGDTFTGGKEAGM
jgi:hypothetical protein